MSPQSEAKNASKQADLNTRIIEAVECCPLLYKGHASIEERQAIWQQMSEQLGVSESILKSRWHMLCAYYQRDLEKRRSTDVEENGDDGCTREFKYENEMAFMMPYMHARIAIAAANAARKQQELAAAGNKAELTDPEFIITENDLEIASRMNNNMGEEYVFYDVETLEGDGQHYQQHQQHMDMNLHGRSIQEEEEETNEQHIVQNVQEEMTEVIEEIDESGNIVVQDLIIEGGEVTSEDGEQIVVEDEEVLQMDDQIETVIEEVVDNTSCYEEMQEQTETLMPMQEEKLISETVVIQSNGEQRVIRMPGGRGSHKYAKIIHASAPTMPAHLEHVVKEEPQSEVKHCEQQTLQSPPSFATEYAVMTRRRRAVVLKATPRVQVELTDNAAANAATNVIQLHTETENSTLDVAANAIISDHCTSDMNDNNENSNVRRHSQQRKGVNERRSGNSHDSSSDYDNRSNDSNAVTTTAAENEEDHTTKGERSEDTIFGELVTAMLKHMPQDRKRAIKKSIMDLLLT